MSKPTDLIKRELIGLEVKVRGRNFKGKVIDETKNMIIIELGNSKKVRIPKGNNTFIFKFGDDIVEINGALLRGRAEDRLKAELPKKWGYIKWQKGKKLRK